MTLVVVIVTVAALVTEKVSAPYAIFGAVTILLVAGVIDAGQAFAGFSNPAPITVAALYVLAAAVEKTGALERITARIMGTGGSEMSDRRLLARVLIPTAAGSSFLNNTPIVAMVAPGLIAWSRRAGRSPSRYLMPVSFAAILGGLITLIGTSTNLVVSGLMREAGYAPFGLFEIGKVGLPFAAAGLAMIVLLAPKLLPVRRSPGEDMSDAREFSIQMRVEPGSPLIGRSVADGGLRNLEGVFLAEVDRGGRRIVPVAPDEVLQRDDRLVFVGNVDRVLDLQRIPGLTSAEEPHLPAPDAGPRRRFFEAVVAPGGALDGRTLRDVGFRNRFGAAVMAIHRGGERVPAKLGTLTLRPGDVLLILAPGDFRRRWKHDPDFLLIAPLDGEPPPRREKARVVGLVTAALFLVVGLGWMDILEAALVAAIALVAFRVLEPIEARNSVDLNVIMVIALSFGLGSALSVSGLADQIAGGLIGSFGPLGSIGLLVGVLLATAMLTELITNNAAAVLMFPIALSAAGQAGLNPRAFAIAVAVGASSSFLSPIGYQTNTMVYGMGGYHFSDFARVGFPLTLVMLIVATIAIPIAWPL